MQEIIAHINTLFQQNQVLSTVAGGSVIVWVVSNIKAIWQKIVEVVRSLISFCVINTYEDNRGGCGETFEAQNVFNRLVAKSKPLWERTKNLDLSHSEQKILEDTNSDRRVSNAETSLTYGFSMRIMFGSLVFCERTIEKSQKITITTTLRVFFARKEKFMRKLVDSIKDGLITLRTLAQQREEVKVYTGECFCGRKFKRMMDSLFTKNNEHYQLLDSIKKFLGNQETYRKLSYPYSYSALLYGEPGCGKSSTILAIASELNKDIVYINSAQLNIAKVLDKINMHRGQIVVFEDIDAINTSVAENRKERHDKKNDADAGVEDAVRLKGDCSKMDDTPGDTRYDGFSFTATMSLSDLLNLTDGLLASDGTICLFTTNHIEKLDPALIRAGRMNMCVKFGNLNAGTANRMIEKNLGYKVEGLKENINPAELQEMILHIVLGIATREDLEKKFCEKD